VTRRGIIKRTCLTDFANSRSRNKGLIAINFKEGDGLLDANLTDGHTQIMIAARNGRCVRFDETDARELGRSSMGVRGINIEEDDEVIGMISCNPDDPDTQDRTILVVSENGFGKRSEADEYRLTNRGAKGVKTINITEKTGKLVAIKSVHEDDDLMIINKSGLVIRMSVSEIRVAGRATQGVKLINIRQGDSIAAVSPVAGADEEEIPAETTVTETE
jgi:DNA gyrase subunit A